MRRMTAFDLSIIVPVFNNEAELPSTLSLLDAAARESGLRVEFLLVDDGSADGSVAVLREFARGREDARVILHRRNYGVNAAQKTGFGRAAAPIVATVEAHLQHDPAEVFRMFALLNEKDADVMCARRTRRADPLIRVAASRAANFLIRNISGVTTSDLNCLLKVWRREAAIAAYARPESLHNILAVARKLRVMETRVDFSRPRAGRSAFSLSMLAAAAVAVLSGAVAARLGRRVMSKTMEIETMEQR